MTDTASTRVPATTDRQAPTSPVTEVASGIYIFQKCLDVAPPAPFHATATGGVVILSPPKFPDYLLNLETGVRIPLPQIMEADVLVTGIDVSPDRAYLSYALGVRNDEGGIISNHLQVLTSDGDVVVERAVDTNWLGFDWLDNRLYRK